MAFDWSPYLQQMRDYSSESELYNTRVPENFFFNELDNPDGWGGTYKVTNYNSPKSAPSGLTARDVVNQIFRELGASPSTGALFGRLSNSGYFNQFADWGEIAGQVGSMTAELQKSSDAGPGGLLKGAYIHAGNMLDDIKENPFAPVGPGTGSMFGGTSSDFLGRPSEETYQEQAAEGVDVDASQWMNNLGVMIGGAAAGAGLANAMGAAGGVGHAASEAGYAGTTGASQAGVGGAQASSVGSLSPGNFMADPSIMQGITNSNPLLNMSGLNQAVSTPNVQINPQQTPSPTSQVQQSPLPDVPAPQQPIPVPEMAPVPNTTPIPEMAGAGGTAAATNEVLDQPVDTSWPDDSVPGGPNGGQVPVPNNSGGTGILDGFDWNSIPENIRSMLQGALAPQGTNWMGMGADLLQLSGQREYQQGLIDTMNRAVDRADPFYSQRGQYQTMFNNMNTNPNWMNEDSVLQGMQNNAMRNVGAQNTAKGYLNSGNMLHDLTRTGVETAGNYALPRMQQVGAAAGAFQGPGQSGQIMSTLGSMAGQAGMQQNQTLGNMMGRISQGGQNSINTGISNWLGGLFAS